MKRLSLANLAREFEKLAEQFHSSAIQVARRKSLQAPRHEIDSIYAVQAGTLLLLALDQGFLKGEKPTPWDLREHTGSEKGSRLFDWSASLIGSCHWKRKTGQVVRCS